MSNVRVYSKEYCPFCKAAKKMLHARGVEFETIDVLENPKRLPEMVKLSNRRTVPQIFFGEEHIGGYDDLRAYYRNLDQQADDS